MERTAVMTTWRTTYCPACRRPRRHFTTGRGEMCSWCGSVREPADQVE